MEEMKVVVLGAARSGKTSFIRRAVLNEFTPAYQETVSIELHRHTLEDDTRITSSVRACFYDCGADALDVGSDRSQTSFTPRWDTLLSNAAAVILVYDVTQQQSLDDVVGYYYPKAMSFFGSARVPPFLMLLGCKMDLDAARSVSLTSAEAFAHAHNMFFLECAAAGTPARPAAADTGASLASLSTGDNMDLVLTILRIRLASMAARARHAGPPRTTATPPRAQTTASPASRGAPVSYVSEMSDALATINQLLGQPPRRERGQHSSPPAPAPAPLPDFRRSHTTTAAAPPVVVSTPPPAVAVAQISMDDLLSPSDTASVMTSSTFDRPNTEIAHMADTRASRDTHARPRPSSEGVDTRSDDAASLPSLSMAPPLHAPLSFDMASLPPLVVNGKVLPPPPRELIQALLPLLQHASGTATAAVAAPISATAPVQRVREVSPGAHSSSDSAFPSAPALPHAPKGATDARRILLHVDVNIGGRFIGKVDVRRHDNPFSLAHKFVSKHAVPPEYSTKLAKVIATRQEAYLRAEAEAEAHARRVANAAEVKSYREKRTVPKPFHLALDALAAERHGGAAPADRQSEHRGRLLGRLEVEYAPGRVGHMDVHAGDQVVDLVRAFQRTYNVQSAIVLMELTDAAHKYMARASSPSSAERARSHSGRHSPVSIGGGHREIATHAATHAAAHVAVDVEERDVAHAAAHWMDTLATAPASVETSYSHPHPRSSSPQHYTEAASRRTTTQSSGARRTRSAAIGAGASLAFMAPTQSFAASHSDRQRSRSRAKSRNARMPSPDAVRGIAAARAKRQLMEDMSERDRETMERRVLPRSMRSPPRASSPPPLQPPILAEESHEDELQRARRVQNEAFEYAAARPRSTVTPPWPQQGASMTWHAAAAEAALPQQQMHVAAPPPPPSLPSAADVQQRTARGTQGAVAYNAMRAGQPSHAGTMHDDELDSDDGGAPALTSAQKRLLEATLTPAPVARAPSFRSTRDSDGDSITAPVRAIAFEAARAPAPPAVAVSQQTPPLPPPGITPRPPPDALPSGAALLRTRSFPAAMPSSTHLSAVPAPPAPVAPPAPAPRAEAPPIGLASGQKPLFNLDVDIGQGRKGRIIVCKDVNVHDLASEFVAAHGLADGVLPRLKELIQSSMRMHEERHTAAGRQFR